MKITRFWFYVLSFVGFCSMVYPSMFVSYEWIYAIAAVAAFAVWFFVGGNRKEIQNLKRRITPLEERNATGLSDADTKKELKGLFKVALENYFNKELRVAGIQAVVKLRFSERRDSELLRDAKVELINKTNELLFKDKHLTEEPEITAIREGLKRLQNVGFSLNEVLGNIQTPESVIKIHNKTNKLLGETHPRQEVRLTYEPVERPNVFCCNPQCKEFDALDLPDPQDYLFCGTCHIELIEMHKNTFLNNYVEAVKNHYGSPENFKELSSKGRSKLLSLILRKELGQK